MMSDAIVGLFSSHRDAEAALLDLQALGLGGDEGQLYARAGRHLSQARGDGGLAEVRARDRAEYAGHGEHLGVTSGARRFSSPNWQLAANSSIEDPGNREGRERTLLVARPRDKLPLEVGLTVLIDHGALAVKDGSGRWHFSLHKGKGLLRDASRN